MNPALVDLSTQFYTTSKRFSVADQPLKKGQKAKQRAQVQSIREIIEITNINDKKYGDLKNNWKTDRIWSRIRELNKDHAGKKVWLRARVYTVRKQGNKMCFMGLRQDFSSIQGIMAANDSQDNEVSISRDMIKYCSKIPPESIVDIFGVIQIPEIEIKSVTQHDIEISILKTFVVSASEPKLPFQLENANNRGNISDKIESNDTEKGQKHEFATVGRSLRLDYRWVDLRTNANHAIFRIQSGVCRFFREFFTKRDFVEIHTPKIIGGVSEGGSEVFRLKYFGRSACLAQSPQLYKQIAVASDLGSVFEIAPVFRAENANTARHLTEFIGMDFEMPIYDHYDEVLDVLGKLFVFIFDNINKHFPEELEAVRAQFPFIPLKYRKETLIIKFTEAIELLREVNAQMVKDGKSKEEIEEAGADINPLKDFSTPNEKLIGRLVKAKYDVDFYIVDRYPTDARPFYTMPAFDNKKYTNSYDAFLRGEEISSGAQRIHDPVLLATRATECDIPHSGIKYYIDSFKYGASPHGGAGIGLERVVMLFLGLENIRDTSLFPHDPRRLTP